MQAKLLQFISLGLLILCLTSCALSRPEGKTEAEIIYKEAVELVDDGRYQLATEKLNAIKSQYPYSYYATHAELLQADIMFEQEEFVEAAAAYILFKDFHPKHSRINYVVWKIAESHYNQLPSSHDRDLAPAYQAIKYYEDLINKFPGSKHVESSKEKIKVCKEMIEAKEQYVADFYFKTEVYVAARHRYLDILETFSSTGLRRHAMLRVVESSLLLKQKGKCIAYFHKFRNELAGEDAETLNDLYQQCNEIVIVAKPDAEGEEEDSL